MLDLKLIEHDADRWGSAWTAELEQRELVRVAELVKLLVSPRMPIRRAGDTVIERLEAFEISAWFSLVAGDVPSRGVDQLVFVPPGTKRRFNDHGLTVLRTNINAEAWESLPIDEALSGFELDELAVRRLQGSRGLLAYLRSVWTGDSMRSVEQLDDDLLANRVAILRADAVAAFGGVEPATKAIDYKQLKQLRKDRGAWTTEQRAELMKIFNALLGDGHKTTSADESIAEALSISASAVKQQRLRAKEATATSWRKAA